MPAAPKQQHEMQHLQPRVSKSTSAWLRGVGAVWGGWAVAWGLATILTVLGAGAGLPFEDAEHGSILLALLAFLLVMLWCAWTPDIRKMWLGTTALGVCLVVIGWFLQRFWLLT